MRIIGGQYRGRRIAAPKGRTSRPTTDRTRESIFNLLSARDDVVFGGARVIDLFAGSGALGLEAMSRGAAHCLFVETDAEARGAIRDNIEALDLFGATRIHRRSATALGPKPAGVGAPFTLAFLDPPYGKGLIAPTVEALLGGGWLARGALLVLEQPNGEPVPECADLARVDRRIYGAAQVAICRFEPNAA